MTNTLKIVRLALPAINQRPNGGERAELLEEAASLAAEDPDFANDCLQVAKCIRQTEELQIKLFQKHGNPK